MVYIFITKNPYTHKTKAKANEQRFYCCSSSQNLFCFWSICFYVPHCNILNHFTLFCLYILALHYTFDSNVTSQWINQSFWRILQHCRNFKTYTILLTRFKFRLFRELRFWIPIPDAKAKACLKLDRIKLYYCYLLVSNFLYT